MSCHVKHVTGISHVSQNSMKVYHKKNFKFFKNIFYWLCYYSLSHFCPLYSPPPCTPVPPISAPPLSSCPWVVHISSLASPFPILFLTFPYFVPTIYASCSLYLLPHSPICLLFYHISYKAGTHTVTQLISYSISPILLKV